jgi:hypothetical protein
MIRPRLRQKNADRACMSFATSNKSDGPKAQESNSEAMKEWLWDPGRLAGSKPIVCAQIAKAPSGDSK